jgi:hypothetical protein
MLLLRYLYYNIMYNIPICFDPQRIIIRESTKIILHKTKLATFVHSRHDLKQSKS